MLLEEYPYKNRPEENKRTEDDFSYGYELYCAGMNGTYLVPLCVGAYGFKEIDVEIEAKNRAHECVLRDGVSTEMFSVYAKIYKLDKNREVIKESIKTVGPLFKGGISVTDECLKNGTVEQL